MGACVFSVTHLHHFHGHDKHGEGGGVAEEGLELPEPEQRAAQLHGGGHGVDARLLPGLARPFLAARIVYVPQLRVRENLGRWEKERAHEQVVPYQRIALKGWFVLCWPTG